MKIAIINLTGGAISGGYSSYLQNMLPRLVCDKRIESLLCVSPSTVGLESRFKHLKNIEFVNCQPFRFFYNRADRELFFRLNKFSPDVIFVPVERSFSFNKIPIVSMVQNMEPFTGFFKNDPLMEKIKKQIQYIEAKNAMKKSDRIIAISKFVREFLVNNLKINSEKIGLVYHGIELTRNFLGRRPCSIPKDWERNFLFTVGSIRPARGLEDAFCAMEYLFLNNSNITGLVVAGDSVANMIPYKKKLEKWLLAHKLSHKVCWVGSLDQNEMAWCYQNCNVFLMTSRVESFGMIAVEAMAYGCICVAANNPCLPEIFDTAAAYYSATNGKNLSEIIQNISFWDDSQRKAASEQAKRRVNCFSWDVCVEKTIAELEKAIELSKK